MNSKPDKPVVKTDEPGGATEFPWKTGDGTPITWDNDSLSQPADPERSKRFAELLEEELKKRDANS